MSCFALPWKGESTVLDVKSMVLRVEGLSKSTECPESLTPSTHWHSQPGGDSASSPIWNHCNLRSMHGNYLTIFEIGNQDAVFWLSGVGKDK